MNLSFLGTKWFLLLVIFVLPAVLLLIALMLNASICIVMILLIWIALALMVFYLPRFQDETDSKK